MIDYVKMDIEGAECEVLRAAVEWAAQGRSIKVEVHDRYIVESCIADLRRLGFDAWSDVYREYSIVGVRR